MISILDSSAGFLAQPHSGSKANVG